VEIERLLAGEETRLRTIRLRALRDAPDAFGSTAAEEAARPPESWKEQLSAFPTFVAVIERRDVGLARFDPDEECSETGWLDSMWVSPEVRGTGIGGALIDAVIDFATSAGYARLELDVGDYNTSAIALYVTKGFKVTGETSSLEPPREHIHEHRRMLKLP
jgi:GNAT superfamily N-acetyltransferase